jgi:hypothetical protein|tara:strand:- start:113 stop:415 length:303 start_codon:yes stop_codon:yes gene_type:complete
MEHTSQQEAKPAEQQQGADVSFSSNSSPKSGALRKQKVFDDKEEKSPRSRSPAKKSRSRSRSGSRAVKSGGQKWGAESGDDERDRSKERNAGWGESAEKR